jgi:polyhydroxybutyrate depolymerase
MQHSDNSQPGSRRARHVAVTICIIAVVLIIVSVAAYSGRARILPSVIAIDPTSIIPAITAGKTQVDSACATPPRQAGDSYLSIYSGGLKRYFLLHLAPSYGAQPQPVVINYHGYDNTAQRTAQHTNMGAEADKAGFMLVFPQGVDNPPSWNAGIGAYGPTGTADDVQFTRDLISFLERNYCVNTQRIYVAGYSLGGGMAYRVACTLSGQVAALATVEGAFYHAPGGCNPSRPIPVLEIHGQADELAPYNGDSAKMIASVQTYLDAWLDHDRCQHTSKVIFQKSDVTGIEWPACADGTVVEHYRISDGGHTWPGSSPIPSLGYTTKTIDANVVIWNFLSQYEL